MMNTKKNLLNSLNNIAEKKSPSDDLLKQFSKCFLDYASATPDNLDCIENLTISDGDVTGLGLNSGELISEIMNSAEGCEIPEQVKSAYPNLNQAQWDAILRLSTIILMLFESKQEKTIVQL